MREYFCIAHFTFCFVTEGFQHPVHLHGPRNVKGPQLANKF